MRFFHDNLIDYAAVSITAGSQQDGLPATNVANEQRKKIWRSDLNDSQHIDFDLGAQKTANCCIILDHNFIPGDVISVYGSNVGPGTLTPIPWTIVYNQNGVLLATFAPTAFRYWEIQMALSAARVTDVGRVFLGTYYETPEPPDFAGYDDQITDLSVVQKSLSGQTYTEQLDDFASYKLSFPFAPESMAEQFKAIFETVGQHRSFFIQVDTNPPLDAVVYVKMSEPFSRKVSGFDSQFYFDSELNFEEQL